MAAPFETKSGPDLQGWAREELGIEAGTPPAGLRAAFLRGVAEEEFVPPEDWRRAYAVLAPATSPDRERDLTAWRDTGKWVTARDRDEGVLREEVEEFAGRFFELAPAERKQRRDQLLPRCDWSPALAARLLALDPGLGVDGAKVVNPRVPARELAGYLCGLFILRPEERAVRRAAFRRLMLADARWKPADWEEAGKYLRRNHPDLAALDPELLQPLSARVKTLRYSPKASRAASNAEPASQSSNRWPWWVVFGIVMAVVRLIGTASKDHSPPPVPTPSFPSMPPLKPMPFPPGVGPTRPGQRNGVGPNAGPDFSSQLVFWRLEILIALQEFQGKGRIGLSEEKRLERIMKEVKLPATDFTDTDTSVRQRFFEAYLDRVAEKRVVAAPVLAELRERLLAAPTWHRPRPNPAGPPQPSKNPPATKAKPTAPTSRAAGPMSQASP